MWLLFRFQTEQNRCIYLLTGNYTIGLFCYLWPWINFKWPMTSLLPLTSNSFVSFLLPSQRKLLAIYLHNDDSVLSNVFCSQMMCADSIVSYLSQNFITWAWDVTKEANKARYQSEVTFRLVAELWKSYRATSNFTYRSCNALHRLF